MAKNIAKEAWQKVNWTGKADELGTACADAYDALKKSKPYKAWEAAREARDTFRAQCIFEAKLPDATGNVAAHVDEIVLSKWGQFAVIPGQRRTAGGGRKAAAEIPTLGG